MTRSDSPLDRVPIVQSVVAGFAAWVTGFLATAALVFAAEGRDDPVGFAGNVLYNAHFAESKLTASGPTSSGSETGSLLAEGVTELPEFLYYLLPIAALLVAGIALGRAVAGRHPDAAAIAGATTAIGYLVLTIGGTYVFEITTESGLFGLGTATIAPTLTVETVAIMGVLYPVVFGAIGGAIGSRL